MPTNQPISTARSESNDDGCDEELREAQAEYQDPAELPPAPRWSQGAAAVRAALAMATAGGGRKPFAGERAEHVVELDDRDGGVGRELVEQEHDDEGDRDAQCHRARPPPPAVAEGEQQAGGDANDGHERGRR